MYTAHGGQRAYTSAEFVIEAYKQLGLFEKVKVNSAEFTVQDVVELNIFDKGFQPPETCQEADVHLGYCQLMGETRLWLKNYNTLEITEWMNQDNCANAFLTHFAPQDGCV